MNQILSTIRDNKKPVLIASIVGVLVTVSYTSQAVFMVHDPKIYVQIAKQIEKASETINHLKKQIDLQVANLQSLRKENVDPLLNDMSKYKSEYDKLKSSMNSILSGTKNAAEAYKETFQDFKNIDLSKASYNDIKGTADYNRSQLEKLNKEATDLISKKQKELEASNERLKKLQEMTKTAKGAKDLAQIQNLIEAENVNSTNITSEINAIRSKQEAYKAQIDKLEKDSSKAMNEKTATDFKDTASKMKVEEKRVTSQTQKFYDLVDDLGWR